MKEGQRPARLWPSLGPCDLAGGNDLCGELPRSRLRGPPVSGLPDCVPSTAGNVDRGREQGMSLPKTTDEHSSRAKSGKQVQYAYAIVRIDDFLGADVPTERRVTVKRVMRDADAAERECARLNSLQGGNGVHYFTQTTRLESPEAVASIEAEVGQTNRIVPGGGHSS